jgi:hypothetical protein
MRFSYNLLISLLLLYFYYILAYDFGGTEVNFTLLTSCFLCSFPVSQLYRLFVIIILLVVCLHFAVSFWCNSSGSYLVCLCIFKISFTDKSLYSFVLLLNFKPI